MMQSISLRSSSSMITARDRQVGVAGDLAGQRVAAVIEVGRAHAFDAREGHRGREQARALHADADDAEADAVAGRRFVRAVGFESMSRSAGRRWF